MKVSHLVLFLGLVIEIAFASSNTSSPSSYFGGGHDNNSNNNNNNNGDYMQWYETTGQSLYNASTFVSSTDDPTQGAAVHWSIHSDHIDLAVAVRASGWLGFGLSENGGMRGSDVFLFETAHVDRIRDAYVLEERVPITDCPQDWELQAWYPGTNETSEFLIVQVIRALDTGDDQDRVMVMDAPPTRIIVAWGDTPEAQYHGPNRVRGAVQWVSDDAGNTSSMKQESTTFRVAVTNYTIPVQATDYAEFCLNATDMARQGIDQPVSIIGIEAMIDQTSHVHHLTVYGFPDASCDSMERSLVYVWAPGEDPLVFPDNVAFYAGPNYSMSFLLEIHYDNVNLIPNVQDNTAVQFDSTTVMRPIEAGMLQLGDPFVQLAGTPVGTGDHTFSCPSSCTSTVLTEPVTVWRESLHMHAHGAQAENKVLRNGTVFHTARVEFFDFLQQGNPAVQQTPYAIEPGDAFRTTCRYESGNRSSSDVRFGLSSQEEMCIAFLLYYPRQTFSGLPSVCGYDIPFDFCAATWNYSNNDTMPRVFGTTNSTECTLVKNVAADHGPVSMHSSEASSLLGQRMIGFTMMSTVLTILTSMV